MKDDVDGACLPKKRLAGLDIARGIGACSVVLHHVILGTAVAGILGETPRAPEFDHTYGIWRMPLFFFLSGLLLPKITRLNYQDFFINRFSSLFWPFLIWGFLQTLVSIAASGVSNFNTPVSQLYSFVFSPVGQFWFLKYLLCATSMLYLLAKSSPRSVITVGALASIGSMAYVDNRYGETYRLLMSLGWCAVGFSIMSTNKFESIIKVISTRRMLLISGATLIALGWPPNGWVHLELITILAGLGFIFGLGFRLENTTIGRALSYLGRNSFNIFLIHILFCAGARVILQRAIGITNPLIHIGVGVSIGIAGPILAAKGLRKFRLEWMFAYKAIYQKHSPLTNSQAIFPGEVSTSPPYE